MVIDHEYNIDWHLDTSSGEPILHSYAIQIKMIG